MTTSKYFLKTTLFSIIRPTYIISPFKAYFSMYVIGVIFWTPENNSVHYRVKAKMVKASRMEIRQLLLLLLLLQGGPKTAR